MNAPTPALLKKVRAELIGRGTLLTAFCENHWFVGQVISGKRHDFNAAALVAAFLLMLRQTQ